MNENEFRITVSRKSPRGYPVLITAPVVFGEPTGTMKLDAGSGDVTDKLARIRGERASDQFLQEFGAFLFRRLLPGNLATSYELSRKHVANPQCKGVLRITLHILAPELHAIPWELLYHPVNRSWIGTNRSSPLSRYVDGLSLASSRVDLPLRILICAAQPRDLPSPDASDEVEALEQVLGQLHREGLAKVSTLPNATRDSLRRRLERFQPHVFHFVGHGRRHGQSSTLILERADRSSDLITGEVLLELFGQAPDVRLVVMSACESDGIAQSLALQGMAAVGMQQPIRNAAAAHFCRNLYEAMTSGSSLDAAVNRARFAVRLECGPDRRDWWLPVTFLSGGRARVFEVCHAARVIHIRSSPPGAEIFLDGTPTGKRTPKTVVIKDARPHRISVRLPGHEKTIPQEVGESAGSEPAQLDFVLRRAPLGLRPVPSTGKVGKYVQRIILPVAGAVALLVALALFVGLRWGGAGRTGTVTPPRRETIPIPGGTLARGVSDRSTTVRLLRSYGLDAGPAIVGMLETPQRTAILRGYLIDKYEVTNADYRRFLEHIRRTGDHSKCHPDESAGKDHTPAFWNDSRFNQDDQPVVGVDFYDAHAYAAWAGKRLPVEDEWELAACGYEHYAYPWGDEYSEQLDDRDIQATTGPLSVHRLSAPRPGAAIGMSGNVAEWTETPGPGDGRVMFRGGAWNHSPRQVYGLTFLRMYADRNVRDDDLGFRCVADLPGTRTPEQMIRIRGGTWELGGDDTPFVNLLRRHASNASVAAMVLADDPSVTHVGPFRIDKFEVTNKDYRAFLEYILKTGDHSRCHPDEPAGKDHTPAFWSDSRFNQDDQPVVGVDFYDAYAYAAWAGKRLPTADEWDLAAKGQTENLYPWGDLFSASGCVCAESGATGPAPAGTCAADRSPYGVVDLGGNVMEWTSDPINAAAGNTRILRGGAWSAPCEVLGLIHVRQMGAHVLHRDDDVGFRCTSDTRAGRP